MSECVEVARWSEVEQVVADTDGVDNVDCEERNPAEHEDACQSQPLYCFLPFNGVQFSTRNV